MARGTHPIYKRRKKRDEKAAQKAQKFWDTENWRAMLCMIVAIWISTLFGLFSYGYRCGCQDTHNIMIDQLIIQQEECNGAPLLLYPPKYEFGGIEYERSKARIERARHLAED